MVNQKKVLVIGEHSYIGNSFKQYIEEKQSKLLENSCKIIVETTGATNGAWKQVDFSNYDVILHVAAIVHQKEDKSKKQLYIDINKKFPVEVAKKAKQAGVKQFIFLSTMAVYGEVEGAITETTPLKPVTMYGKSKLAAENQLQKLASKQFKVVIVRPPMVYGENCPGNYTRLKKLAKCLPIFPDIDNKRSMLSIENLSHCIMLLIQKESQGIICPRDKEPVKTTDLFINLRKEIGKKTWTIKIFNRFVMRVKGKVGSVNKLFGSCYYKLEEEVLLPEKYNIT